MCVCMYIFFVVVVVANNLIYIYIYYIFFSSLQKFYNNKNIHFNIYIIRYHKTKEYIIFFSFKKNKKKIG